MQQLTKIPCLIFCYFDISSSWTIPAKANPILDLLGHYGGNILLVCPGNYHQAIAPRATRHGIIGTSINVPSGGWLCNFISLLPLVGGGGSSDGAIQATWENHSSPLRFRHQVMEAFDSTFRTIGCNIYRKRFAICR